MRDPRPALTIVGLGPGDPALLTREAAEVLEAAPEVWLRTWVHPTVRGLSAGPRYQSLDDAYETGATFEDVYRAIVARVLELARRPEGVVYAVPGHPLFGEATSRELLARAGAEGLKTRVVAGVSFLDAVTAALGVDPLDGGMLLVDALALGSHGRALAPQRPTVVAQVYDRRTASLAKLALLDAYPAEHPVRIVRAGAGEPDRVLETTLAALDHDDVFDHLTSLYLPPVTLTDDVRTFEGLRRIVAQLRAPDGGCPWDLEQTHETLKRYLLEEAYEALDALDALAEDGPHRLAEELGDLLMQVVLHAQVAEDNGEFTIEDVFASIAAKLVRRHPHVFGDVQVAGSADVLRNWEELKKEERGGRPLLDAVPKAMPALAQAQSVQSRAAKAGLAPPADANRVRETLRALGESDGMPSAADLGDALFAVAELAREHDLDAEEALRLAVRRFRDDVSAREAGASAGAQ